MSHPPSGRSSSPPSTPWELLLPKICSLLSSFPAPRGSRVGAARSQPALVPSCARAAHPSAPVGWLEMGTADPGPRIGRRLRCLSACSGNLSERGWRSCRPVSSRCCGGEADRRSPRCQGSFSPSRGLVCPALLCGSTSPTGPGRFNPRGVAEPCGEGRALRTVPVLQRWGPWVAAAASLPLGSCLSQPPRWGRAQCPPPNPPVPAGPKLQISLIS